MSINVIENKMFIDIESDYTLYLNLKKFLLVKFWYNT